MNLANVEETRDPGADTVAAEPGSGTPEPGQIIPGIDEIIRILGRHEHEARQIINMVPSENSMSALAKIPMLLDVYHRYFFNASENPAEWNFRGSQGAERLETRLALPLLREFTRARYVNLRPLSGLSGMAMVVSALGGPQNSTILTVSPEQGGHYATASLAARLGFRTAFMTGPDPHTIDFGQVAELIRRHSPTLIYVDQSTCLFPLNVARLVEVTRRTAPSTLVHVDCSHWLGLIFGGQFDNPLELGADSFGGSTHKSFPGPQKAVVATNRKDLWDRIYQAQFEMISSHHFAETISLGIALLEFRDCGGAVYAERVLENTRTFGRQLHNLGIDVAASERGFSAGHQLWIKPSASGVDAAAASDRLYGAGIRVNVFPELPGIPEPAIRIGLNEATYHGLVVTDMAELASIFAAALLNLDDPGSLARRTAQLRLRYRQPYSFSKNRDGLADSALRLLSYALGAGPNRGEGAGFTGAFGRADNGAYE